MSARESLSRLVATRGKGGSIEAITQASQHFGADNTLVPSGFISTGEKLDSAKAVVLYGGFISNKYGVAPKDVFSMRDVISKKYADLNGLLDLAKDEFLPALEELEAELVVEVAEKAALESQLGLDAERFVKSASVAIDKVVIVRSPKVRYELEQLAKRIENLLEYQKVSELMSA
jgi:hypothetical protein